MAETATAKKLKKMILCEDVQYQAPTAVMKVHTDGDQAWIDDVKLLGFTSKNRRRYNPNGVNAELYEDSSLNVNHPSKDDLDKKKPRAFEDRFGWVVGPYKTEDGLYAKKLMLNPKHQLFETFSWWAANKPGKIGLSQNAFGDVYEDADGEMVEQITDVRSIDLVADPASTKGLFEHLTEEDEPTEETTPITPAPTPPVKKKVETKKTAKPAVKKKVNEGMDDEPVMEDALNGGEATTDQNDIVTPEGSGDGEFDDALCQAAGKIFDDPQMDVALKLKKIKALLMIKHDKGTAEALLPLAEVADLDSAKKLLFQGAAKSGALRLVLEALDGFEVKEALDSKKATAQRLIEAAKLPKEATSAWFMKTLMECEDEREMQLAIEDRRALTGVDRARKPRSASPESLLESEAFDGDPNRPLSDEEQKKNYDAFEAAVLKMAN